MRRPVLTRLPSGPSRESAVRFTACRCLRPWSLLTLTGRCYGLSMGWGSSICSRCLARWQFQDVLVRPATGLVYPGTSCTLAFAAAYDKVDAMAEQARAHGGGQVRGPVDTGWNTRDLTTSDPDGNIVITTAARPTVSADRQFSNNIQQWNREQGLKP